MFHSNWVISDYHSFVWAVCWIQPGKFKLPNKWMVVRNDPVTVNIRNGFLQTLERWWWHLFWLQILIPLPIWAKWPFWKFIFSSQWRFWNMIFNDVCCSVWCCNGKKMKWRCRGSNQGPFTCKANAVPLSYIPILEDGAFKKYYIHLFTVARYFVVMIRAEWSEYFYFYQTFLLWKVSWLAQYKI